MNPFEHNIRKRAIHFLLWKCGYYKEQPEQKEGEDFCYPLVLPSFDETKPSCVWINHSTFLLQVGETNFLTDPCFSFCCSPFAKVGPKRHHPPALTLYDLPKIDYVLISHNHYDHLDKKSILTLFHLYPDSTWIVPYQLKKWFLKRGLFNVIELSWWESFQNNGVKISAVPAQHFSGRYLLDLNRTLWAGFVVESGSKKFYFSGDTGYNAVDFKKVGERFRSIDLSLLPIGAYRPRSFMKPVHVDPAEAVLIHQEVHSKLSIGMHWKTFHLSEEPMGQPPLDLFLAMKAANLDPRSFIAIRPGIYVNW